MIPCAPAVRPAAVLLPLLAAVLSACSGGDKRGGVVNPPPPDLATAQVEVTAPAGSLQAEQSMQLVAVARNAAGTQLSGKAFTWQSSDAALATVSSSGMATGRGAGAVTFTATETGSSRSGSVSMPVMPVPIATLAFEPTSISVEVGATQPLKITAIDVAGRTLSGRTVTVTSSNGAVASVSGSTVTAVAPGSATLTASAEGKIAQATVTVIPVRVASMSVAPGEIALAPGATVQFTATLKDAAGNVLTGREVRWQSFSSTVATVDERGLATARAAGEVTIRAEAEGKIATARMIVAVPVAARVAVTPAFATVDVGAAVSFTASAFTAAGVAISNPSVSWGPPPNNPAVALVSASGVVSGVTPGSSPVVARANSASDTAFVAVLGPRSLLSTAFVGAEARAVVRAGQTITVPVVLDLSRVSSNGDLGAAQFVLSYDPAVLLFRSAVVGIGGADFHVPMEGSFRFSFAGTQPLGSSRVTLATVTFQVAPGTAAGTRRALGLSYSAQPASTGFQRYERPVAVGASIRVVD
ncbi:MAG TPA: Ig-like domain-containing protein [Longimicrobium sp.]